MSARDSINPQQVPQTERLFDPGPPDPPTGATATRQTVGDQSHSSASNIHPKQLKGFMTAREIMSEYQALDGDRHDIDSFDFDPKPVGSATKRARQDASTYRPNLTNGKPNFNVHDYRARQQPTERDQHNPVYNADLKERLAQPGNTQMRGIIARRGGEPTQQYNVKPYRRKDASNPGHTDREKAHLRAQAGSDAISASNGGYGGWNPSATLREGDKQLFARKYNEANMTPRERAADAGHYQASNHAWINEEGNTTLNPRGRREHTPPSPSEWDSADGPLPRVGAGSYTYSREQHPEGGASLRDYMAGKKHGRVESPIHLGYESKGSQGKQEILGGHHRLSVMAEEYPDEFMPVVHSKDIIHARSPESQQHTKYT